MADPTGTVGQTSGPPPDLVLAVRGGPEFVHRLQQLADAADRLDQTAAKAGFGDDVAGALRQAEARLADAEAQQERARKALDDANAKAKEIRDKANQQASDVSKLALANSVRTEAEADGVRKDADAYAKRVRDEADAIIRADVVRREAEAKGRDIDSRLNRLNASLRAIRREWESRA
jgi:F0F1-type ATP synthase membrane subunit b/b'